MLSAAVDTMRGEARDKGGGSSGKTIFIKSKQEVCQGPKIKKQHISSVQSLGESQGQIANPSV